MKRLTRKSETRDMVLFIDHDNNGIGLDPSQMQYSHNKLAIERLNYYENLEEQGRLVIIDYIDIDPCKNCEMGWESLSSEEGYASCHDTCTRLKEFNKNKDMDKKLDLTKEEMKAFMDKVKDMKVSEFIDTFKRTIDINASK